MIQISENLAIHHSYLQTEDYGAVTCNGLIYFSGDTAVIFDTPTTNPSAAELIHWIEDSTDRQIGAVVVGHFHTDCLGGLEAFNDRGIRTVSSQHTARLADSLDLTVPVETFNDAKDLVIDNKIIELRYFGQGHTKDNIVSFIPAENTLYGGCLVKSIGSGEGFTGDGNVHQWSSTISKIKDAYGKIDTVIPGHGKHGDAALLEYTIALFKKYQKN